MVLTFLKNFLLILRGFHVIHPDPTHFIIPSHLLSALATPTSQITTKFYRTTKNQPTNQTKNSWHRSCSVAQ